MGSIIVSILMLLNFSTSYAELNENCTISVLNRTAQVKADGSWVLPNVPSNMGLARVRATCVENGITRSGQSDWVAIPTGGTIDPGDIPLDAFEPSPSAVTLSTPTTTLTAIGGTAQLTVTAAYPGDTTRDITSGSAGTVYGTTNAAIATVSGNGLVTATGTGRVIISASNEMVLSSLLFTITQSDNPDADNDGIPDDWELANGLNPNDQIDALEDPDHDGLTNKQEYDNATEMRNPDTDNDGIQDGEEVMSGKDGFVTNPLLADSDGDGIRDGLEVQTGSDPTNSASYNLGSALSHIEITPSNFVIVYNTIMTEASRQLTVTGVLIDGNRIDLTSTARGTSYSSSDLSVANFGAADGMVFASQNGVATITAANSGFNAAAQVTVRTFFPTALSYVNIPGFANNVDVSGNYAYVAAGSTGLQVVDISDPLSPGIVGSLDTPGNANDVKIVGQYAYIADGSSGLTIIDINNPATPLFTGTIDTPETAWDLAVSGTYAYIADGMGGLQILDISNPAAPALAGSVDTPGTAKGVAISGDYAVIADSTSVKIIDISNPGEPQYIGSVDISGDAMDVIAEGSIAYIAGYTGGLITIDFTNPASPVITSTVGDNYLFDIARSGNFAFGADVLRFNASPIYNLSNPLNPVFSAILNFSIFWDYDGTGIAAVSNYLYLTASKGIIENGTTGNTRLFIGQYAEILDSGTIPPTVSVISPADGTEVFEGATISITVSAEDDVAVGSVNLLIDGEVVSADYSPPYQFNYQVPVGITSLAIGATAIDLNNNIGTAPNVFISVLPSPQPVVSITSPSSGETIMEDSIITIIVDATDDTAVASVDFLINGSVITNDTTPPYQIPYLVPVGITTLTIGATATDNNGRVGIAADVVVNVISDSPPVVSITNPASGATIIEESIITITADATDDSAVASVDFIVDGSVIATDAAAPYQTSYPVPIGITSLTIGATATDNNGKIGIASDVVVNVIPDPGTTVTGRVVDNSGQPVEGATVTTLGISAITGPDGSFNIPDVPTVRGDIIVNAYAVINNETHTGRSSAITPIPGGITDVGDIKLRKGIIAIDGGRHHSLALKDDGSVWAWGNNSNGQLGDGTTDYSLTPIHVSSLSDIIAIAAGGDSRYGHSLAVKRDGTVWAWGDNRYGQLGDGTETDRLTPVQVIGLSNVIAVAAGYYHSLALKGDGTVWAWGEGEYGEIGDETWQSLTPVQVNGLGNVIAVAAGNYHSLALKNDGSVWAWGNNNYGQLGVGTEIDESPTPLQISNFSGVAAIAAGDSHSLAVKGDGTVWAWGANWAGQLGDGTTTERFTPNQVSSIDGVAAIAAGGEHSLAVKGDGSVSAWGYNGNGQLGDGTWDDSLTPVQVSSLSGVVIVAAGDSHSLAVKGDGSVWAWGYNGSGQLGNGSWGDRLTPVQVVQLVYISPLNNVAAVAAGYYHSLTVKDDGGVLACGYNGYGQLGDGTWTDKNTLVQVSGLSNVVAAAAGFHSLAVKGDGSAWAWGPNYYGQLGNGTWTDKNTPVQVSGLDNVVAVAAGVSHSLALKGDGSVWAWGYNRYGQIGDGTTWTNRNTPVQVSSLDGVVAVVAVAAGGSHSLALKADGTVWAWGYNQYGQLGNNGWSDRATPVQVRQYIDNNNNVVLSNVVAVAAGGSHSLALKADGTVWAWGYNYFGQLGDGTTTHWNMAVQVIGLSNATAIAAGSYHSLAVNGNGSVWAWGYNSYGQLGDGTETNRLTPVQVSGLDVVVSVIAGYRHSLAVKRDGTIWGWGYNSDGQLGDGKWNYLYNTPIQLWHIDIVDFR